jgi:hypothetical protein
MTAYETHVPGTEIESGPIRFTRINKTGATVTIDSMDGSEKITRRLSPSDVRILLQVYLRHTWTNR